MRYRLRTLVFLTAILPVLAALWFLGPFAWAIAIMPAITYPLLKLWVAR